MTEQSNADIQQLVDSTRWYHTFEVLPGITTKGRRECTTMLNQLDLPEDCSGMRALDIGAADGFFSFELERRGATVVALDYERKPGFTVASQLRGSKVEHVVNNVYNISPETYGQFDIILFLGVLYHLKNPMLALDNIRTVARDRLYIETVCIDHGFLADSEFVELSQLSPKLLEYPIAQFYPKADLAGDSSNYWGFNSVGLKKVVEECEFLVKKCLVSRRRIVLECQVADDADLHRGNEKERAFR